uniref:P40 n=1 Tax=Setaria digitata TaxID=48799 RepID=A0A915PU87_9BILA
MPNPPPKEDEWAFGPIGSPFPDNPVRVLGQPNMYVALWYKYGVPIHGRAWNNGGVLECSFPYKKAELRGIKDLGGQIQVLQYKGDHNTLGFWYEWIKYKDRFEKSDIRQVVHCGDSMPILWKDRTEGALLGYLDNKTELAHFSHDGKAESLQGPPLGDMWIIVRNTEGGPPTCGCKHCYKPPPPKPPPGPPPPRVMIDEWVDLRAGDPWPADKKLIKALDKNLNTFPGENPEQYVALWYQQGEPVMGRIWNNNGKVAACFGWNNNEYREKVGSLQILVELPDFVRGYDYSWKPFSVCASFGEKEWFPVYVDRKGIISPCVCTIDGKEILGKADIRNEKASAAFGGKETVLVGPPVQQQMVLCRKARPGYKFD